MQKYFFLLFGFLILALLFAFVSSVSLAIQLGIDLKYIDPLIVLDFINSYGFERKVMISLGLGCSVCTGVSIVYYFNLPKHYYGKARWAKDTDIQKAKLFEKQGILLGKIKKKYLKSNEPHHVLVAAPTRSGKGVGIVIPNLLSWSGSAVVLDIKQENYETTSGFRANHGQKVFIWSPADETAKSHRFNPLDTVRHDIIHRVGDLQRLATILLPNQRGSDPMWQNEARDLFVGLALYVFETSDMPKTIGQIYRILKSDTELGELFEYLIKTRGDELSAPCVMAFANFMNKATKERSGVKSNLTASLNLWSNPVVDAATSASDFDISRLRKEGITIYVGVTLNQLEALAPLLSLFFQQTIDVLSRNLPTKEEKFHVLMMIDEFAALGRMDVIAKNMAFLAGYHVRMVNIIQGLGQLQDLYQAAGTENIIQNSAIQIYFAANDTTTAEYVSKRLGTKTIRTESKSHQGGFSKVTKSASYAARSLMLPEEVRQLSDNNAIIFREGSLPILAQKIRFFNDPSFKSRLLPKQPIPSLIIEEIRPIKFDIPKETKDPKIKEKIKRIDEEQKIDLDIVANYTEQLQLIVQKEPENLKGIAANRDLKASILNVVKKQR